MYQTFQARPQNNLGLPEPLFQFNQRLEIAGVPKIRYCFLSTPRSYPPAFLQFSFLTFEYLLLDSRPLFFFSKTIKIDFIPISHKYMLKDFY